MQTWTRGSFTVSTDPSRLDLDVIHGFLKTSYWAREIPRRIVEQALANSLCFGLYRETEIGEIAQIGFARIVTDRSTFAYLADVFVLPDWRGRELSKFLMGCVKAHPDLKDLRRWLLMTADAHGLYRQFGFTALAKPDRAMEIADPDIYRRMSL